MWNKKKGFTLVELLIVIAVIAILFILIISKVNFASDKAKDAGVLTDFRSYQIGLDQTLRETGYDSETDLDKLVGTLNKNLDSKLRLIRESEGSMEYRSIAKNPYGFHYVLKKEALKDGEEQSGVVLNDDSIKVKVYSIKNNGDGDKIASNSQVYAATSVYSCKLLVMDIENSKDSYTKDIKDVVLGIQTPGDEKEQVGNNVKQIAGGNGHTLVLMGDGTVKAFGSNLYGQLGLNVNSGTSTPITEPTTIPGLAGVKQVATGYYHSLVLMEDGTVKSFGQNWYGQLGRGVNIRTGNPNLIPTEIAGLSNVTQITVGSYHSIALLDDGTVVGFGYNKNGQLGTSTAYGGDYSSYTPNIIPGLEGVKQVSAGLGGAHTLALLEDGTVKALGQNYFGELGILETSGGSYPNPHPTTIPNLNNVKQVEAGAGTSFAVLGDGTVKSFGLNFDGALGVDKNSGTNTPNPSPALIGGVAGVDRVATNGSGTIMMMGDGTVKSFGSNRYGQLGTTEGNGSSSPNPTPTELVELSGAKQVWGGLHYTFVMFGDGTIGAFGYNNNGQLGTDVNVGTENANPMPIIINLGGI